MGSDRARITYDPTRRYQAVVKQQGRVTLEADDNEAFTLIGEGLRSDVLDFVGPSGTPDDGYAVSDRRGPHDLHIGAELSPHDFYIRAGTLYIGGMRLGLPAPIRYGAQPDWVDHAGDPEWIDPEQVSHSRQSHEYIYLFLREQEVSAIEDTALREVALGGPDTAQRLRLIQRVMRLGTDASDCAGGLATAKAHWAALGLTFNERTMRLRSTGQLQADFDSPGAEPLPCEPQAHGGYLGADNQLIRVQISSAREFIWGFDNASFLYRVTVIDSQTLELQSSPVDSFHFPRAGQAVEVLRTAAKLGDADYIASATGVVQTLAAPYAASTRRITLPNRLPAEYLNANETPVVFLRVWEERKAFTPGEAVSLGTTGLRVTLSGGAPFHVGDYWMIAVRPGTSNEVYPHRYLDAPQPPDGPRMWACPLAVIDWGSGAFEVLADCREPFDNLVELTKRKAQACCTVTVGDGVSSVGQFTDIQSAVDEVSANGGAGRVCILAGKYRLKAPVAIKSEGLIVSGCGIHTLVLAPEGDNPAFVIQGAERVTLESLLVMASSKTGAVKVVGSQAVEIANCSIFNTKAAGYHLAPGLGPALTAMAAGKQGSADLVLVDNELRGFPAVSVQAERVRLSRNRITGGGVWLREGSADVAICANEIVQGQGPGILLGGLMPSEEPAWDNSGVSGVLIASNRIKDMEASGITTFAPARRRAATDGAPAAHSYVALAQEGPLALVEDLTIAHNDIVGCASGGIAAGFDPEAAGGIVVRWVAGLRVRSNYIADNGAAANSPACGVFVHTCLGVELADNTVLGNGGEDVEGEGKAYQGGIVGLNVIGASLKSGGKRPGLQVGGPAALIHDNVVTTPSGQALLLVAIGSLSVEDNVLTSRGVANQPDALAHLGDSVHIRDLGQAPGLSGGAAADSQFEYAGLTENTINLIAGGVLGGFSDGRILFHGNQIALRLPSEYKRAVGCAVALVSRDDDVSFQDNQAQVDAPSVLLCNVLAVGATVRASCNRFTELALHPHFSYYSAATWNIATGNQATHCIQLIGTNLEEEHNHVLITANCERLEGQMKVVRGFIGG